MAADPISKLHALIDQLSNEEASALLINVRQIAARRRPNHEIPTMHIAPPITSIDDLRSNLFPPEESADDFDNSIGEWREEGSQSSTIQHH